MARDHGRLRWTLWDDPAYVNARMAEQWLYKLILGQAELNFAGVIGLFPTRWAGMSPDATEEIVAKALRGLVAAGLLLVDDRTEEVLVRNHIEDDGLLSSPNMAKAAATDFRKVKSRMLRAAIQIEVWALAELPDTDRPPGCCAGAFEPYEVTRKDGSKELKGAGLKPILDQRLPEGMEPGFTAGLGGRFRRELPGWLDSEWAVEAPRPITGDVRKPFRQPSPDASAKPLGKPFTEPSPKPLTEGSTEGSPEPLTEPYPEPSPQGLGQPSPKPSGTPAPAPSPSPALAPTAPATGTGQALARPDDVEGVIAEARWARPAWTERQIRWALERAAAAGRNLLEIRGALLAVAADENTESPTRITHAGPWWQRTDLASLPPMPPWCRLCDLASSRQVRAEPSGEVVPCPACHPTQSAPTREVVTA